MSRRALTLIEVAFALGLVSTAVITIFMLLPMGVRTQLNSRYKILAIAKALEVMEAYRGGGSGAAIDDARGMDKEGVFPWDTHLTYRAWAPDLECYLEGNKVGMKPLPDRIAARLDSDDDEIRRLIDAGGHLYYVFPTTQTASIDMGAVADADKGFANESRKLIVGVVGLPQQNAILYHPSVKVGPYQEFYPSPPTHGQESIPRGLNDLGKAGDASGKRLIAYDALCRGDAFRAGSLDADVAQVLITNNNITYQPPGGGAALRMGYLPYLTAVGGRSARTTFNDNATNVQQQAAAQAYVLAALWYARRVGLPSAAASDPNSIFSLTSIAAVQAWIIAHPDSCADAVTGYRHVQAMRFLAHAAICLTHYYFRSGASVDRVRLGEDPTIAGFRIDLGGTTVDGNSVTDVPDITLPVVQAWHELSLRLAIAHADVAGPYNWGAPRPLNRQVMMDHPLVQLDLWSPPITAVLPAPGGTTAPRAQWRACYPEAIRFPGTPFSLPGRHRDSDGNEIVDWRDNASTDATFADYPARVLDTNNDGVLDERDLPVPISDSAAQPALAPRGRFNLTAPFEPAERCRQLVVWAVDWQSYVDFETAPSASIDASRHFACAPFQYKSAGQGAFTARFVQRTPERFQSDCFFRTNCWGDGMRNPECVLAFRFPSTDPASGRAVIGDLPIVGALNDLGNSDESDPRTGQSPDVPSMKGDLTPTFRDPNDTRLSANRMIFMGAYGANRNAFTTSPNLASNRGSDFAKVEVGIVPTSVRMRASTVCRFNFYDLRVQGGLRN